MHQDDVTNIDRALFDRMVGAKPEPDPVDALPLVDMPRTYGHVWRALHQRPWAIEPGMLARMAAILDERIAGGAPSIDVIAERLAEAKAANGERSGGAVAGGVAVIPMYGVISQRESLMSSTSGGTSVDAMRRDLRQALADPAIRAVVFDIDSPGGSVDGITEFASELRALRRGAKPIVAQVNTLAASAAYWLASSMSEIVTTASGEVGSIGVYAMHQDMSEAAAKAGVKTTLVSAGEFKVEGNQFEPLTDDARAHIQSQVDENYGVFLADVAKGRGISVDAVLEGYGKGRTFLSRGALQAGMVDRIDTLEATVQRLNKPGAVTRAAAEVIQIETVAEAPAPVDKPTPDWNRLVAGLTKR